MGTVTKAKETKFTKILKENLYKQLQKLILFYWLIHRYNYEISNFLSIETADSHSNRVTQIFDFPDPQ